MEEDRRMVPEGNPSPGTAKEKKGESGDNCFLRLDSSCLEMIHFIDLFIHLEVDHSVRKEEP